MPGRSGQWWGWHRLDDRAAQQLVERARVQPGDLVLDLGAGTGSVTAALVDAGARVIAFELHPQRVSALRARFADAPVTVVAADVGDVRLPRRAFKVVANPPFGRTTAIVTRLLHDGSRVERADLVVPTGIARRWTDRDAPGRRRWAAQWRVSTRPAPPRHAFRPPPPMPVAVLVIERRR